MNIEPNIVSKSMSETTDLTDALSPDMLHFEKNIAYFFGVDKPEAVAHHYIEAVKAMESLGKNPSKMLLYLAQLSTEELVDMTSRIN